MVVSLLCSIVLVLLLIECVIKGVYEICMLGVYVCVEGVLLDNIALNDSQLAKMEKSIPHMPLP